MQDNQNQDCILQIAALELQIAEKTAELSELRKALMAEEEAHHKTVITFTDALDRMNKIVSCLPGFVFQCRINPDGEYSFPYGYEGIKEILRLNPEKTSIDTTDIKSYIHPEDCDLVFSSSEESLRTMSNYQQEFRIKSEATDFRWCWVNAIPTLESDGAVLWHGFISDITDRKQAEDELQESRETHRGLSEAAFDSIFFSEKGVCIEQNQMAEKMFGYTTEEALGRYGTDWIVAEDRKTVMDNMLAGYEEPYEVTALKKDGSTFPCMLSGKMMFYKGKNVRVTSLSDISARKKAETALKESENRFSLFMDFLPAIVFIKDEMGRMLYVNKYMDNAFGASAWIGKTMYDVLQNELGRKMLEDDINAVNTGYQRVEESMEQLDGKLHIYQTQKFAIPRSGHKPLIGGIALDITDRILGEEETRKARHEAEKANFAKSEFLSRMSHELRTPLNSILGFAQLMDLGELNLAHRKGINHILSSGKHLLNLINEVLDISSIESGWLSFAMQPVQLNGIIMDMIDIIQPDVIKLRIKIQLLQSPTNKLFVNADPNRLKQVLLNLINNAVKYNHEGGSILISTELIATNGNSQPMLRIAIHDTGMGIKPENLEKLFLPFERIGAEKTVIEGTGLGLTVVKKLTEAMGGIVGVESKAGNGSTFWIELPQIVNKEATLVQTDESSKPQHFASKKAGTILYIEDNPSNLDLVEQILLNQRPEITLVSIMNGLQALSTAIEYKPDLILLDLDLPDIKGLDVIRMLKSNSKTMHVPVVVISADATSQQFETLLEAGAKNYLTKPLDVINFLEVVDTWIYMT